MLSFVESKLTMRRIARVAIACIAICSSLLVCSGLRLLGSDQLGSDQVLPANPSAPASVPNATAGTAPVMTFVDPNNQPYGRYIVYETVPVEKYTFEPVKEKLYVARTVTEPRTVTQTQYTPIYSYQPQLRSVRSWNPFEQPRQVWEYVPIVQYQPSFVPVIQNVTFQKYEEQEVTKMIPVLKTVSEQIGKYADRPIGALPPGGTMISSVPIGNPNATNPYNVNVIQQSAQVAQANRNTTRIPTRPIDYPVPGGFNGGNASLANAPGAYYPSTANTTLIPAIPLQPGVPQNGYPNGYAPNPYLANANQQPSYYSTASARPIQVPSFLTRQGSLFGSGVFSNNRTTGYPVNANGATYVASSAPVPQPYPWGASSQSPNGFRPSTGPNTSSSPYGGQQPAWGMVPSSSYRDSMQGGMQPTELR